MLPIAKTSLATLAAGLAFAAAAPAQAQDETDVSVNQLIVYGDDPCPRSTADQITVCARKEEDERFRIPEPLRESDSPQNDAWNNKVLAYETVGKNGTLSCSPAGAGGWTGCVSQMIDMAYAEKRTDESVRFSELIAAARAERLSVLDDEAAAEQARVEDAEREFFERDQAVESEPAPEGE
ncbi:MAG: hypothetical protein R3D89_11190 [Sphingomonadaceae bacterium]